MAFSPQYLSLCKRIAELRRNLLPATFDPMGIYHAEVYDKTRGFVALVHAEIENYIEDRCLEIANQSVQPWNGQRITNRVIFSLHTVCYTGWSELGGKPENLSVPTNQLSVEARLGDALGQYKKVVGENHGIKEDNLKWLLVPLSIRLKGDLDENWLTSMSNFGSLRGGIVHQAGKVNNRPNPKDFLIIVWKQLIPGLKQLDLLLSSLI